MTVPRRRYDLPPRVLSTAADVAGYLGRGPTWFSERREELERHGFPKPLPVLDGWDRDAIDRWIDRLGGLPPGDDEHDWDAALTAAARETVDG